MLIEGDALARRVWSDGPQSGVSYRILPDLRRPPQRLVPLLGGKLQKGIVIQKIPWP